MKAKLFLIFLLSYNSVTLFAQETNNDELLSESNHYQLQYDIGVTECNIFGAPISGSIPFAVKAGYIFTVTGYKGSDSVIITFWNFENDSGLIDKLNLSEAIVANNKANKESVNPNRYFLISVADLNYKAIKYYSTWKPMVTGGAVLLPIKLRYKPFDFSKDVTLGFSIGLKSRISRFNDFFLNALFSVGITSVTLDSLSTNGQYQNSDRPAFTPAFGLVGEFNNIQFGIFTGWDKISTSENVNWIYNGKPWLSIGFGYTILSQQSTAVSKKVGRQKRKYDIAPPSSNTPKGKK